MIAAPLLPVQPSAEIQVELVVGMEHRVSTNISTGVVGGFDEVSFLYYCNGPVFYTETDEYCPIKGRFTAGRGQLPQPVYVK